MTTALVVDDEPAICQSFEALLHDLNCDVCVAASAEEGLQLAMQQHFDIIVLDVRLPGMDGVTALAELRAYSRAPVIVMTAHGSLSTAVNAVQEGAFEYLPKPFDLQHVTDVLKRAISESVARFSESLDTSTGDRPTEQMVGDSLPMQHLFRQVAMAAQHDAPVLITGESGTGKELVAQAIHQHSARRNSPLVPVHLASLNEALLERELFGHTSGAFTGADSNQSGVIAQASGSTLFLDEIGETPLHFQVKLLRTLESGEYYPVGAASPQKSDFRLIAATNVPLDVLRSAKHFRQDFFFRLATIQIVVPPLREHLEDVPQLAQQFLQQHSPDASRHFTPESQQFLQQHLWPGNIRELRNVVISAASATAERAIGVSAVKSAMNLTTDRTQSQHSQSASPQQELQSAARAWARQALSHQQPNLIQAASEMVESELIAAALQHTQGNRSAAAQLLGIHRETLRDKLAKHSIDADRTP